MNLLIKSAQVLDPQSPHHQTQVDLHIQNGMITEIGDRLDVQADQVIQADGLKVSQGWVDMRAHFNDPGHEQKEDFESGIKAAASAGFTKVLLMPNVSPVVDQKSAVKYIIRNSESAPVDLLPCAAVTKNADGSDLTEMIDLREAGAVAFSDGLAPLWHTDIMLKALQYVQKFDGVLINRAEDKMLTAFAHMHEGQISTLMGVKGMPVLSETIMIERDLKLLAYTGGRLHISMVSAKESVELIRKAKANGLRVTCDVGVNYLKFTDTDLEDYDTTLKVNPPYRTQQDRQALIEGVLDGTIDTIVSDHQPHDEEAKKLEFDLADFGSNNLQGFLPIINEVASGELVEWIAAFTSNPRQILGLTQPTIKQGSPADLTVFDTHTNWTFDEATNKSKSIYSPLWNKQLMGRVHATVNKTHCTLY